MSGYVCGCVLTHSTKSCDGPCWCGTKCRSLIKTSSCMQALRLKQSRASSGDSLLQLSLFLSHTYSTHTHTLLDTRFYLSLTSPRGLWADVLTLNNTIRNLLLPQDIGVTTHSPSLLLGLANFLTLFHTRIHTRTHRFAQLFLLGHCIDSLCTT